MRLGSGVYCVAYRNPGLLAKSLTTIDHLSDGRVEIGLGAGWHDVEAKAFGMAFPSIGIREGDGGRVPRARLHACEHRVPQRALRLGSALEAFAAEIVRGG